MNSGCILHGQIENVMINECRNSPINQVDALSIPSRSRSKGNGVVIGGGSGEIFLLVLDPGKTEPVRLGKGVYKIEILFHLSGEKLGHSIEGGATFTVGVGHVLPKKYHCTHHDTFDVSSLPGPAQPCDGPDCAETRSFSLSPRRYQM